MTEVEIRQTEYNRLKKFIWANREKWHSAEQQKFIDYCVANSTTPELDLTLKLLFNELKG